jgi:signal peptidase II
MTKWSARGRDCALVGGVLFADRLTKWMVENWMGDSLSFAVVPGFFNLVRTENRGAAFSLLADLEGPLGPAALLALSVAAALIISVTLWRSGSSPYKHPGLRFGLALMLGGALGNLIDRAVRGAVTDFVELYAGSFRWPAFNVADAAITVGALAALLDVWRRRREHHGA